MNSRLLRTHLLVKVIILSAIYFVICLSCSEFLSLLFLSHPFIFDNKNL